MINNDLFFIPVKGFGAVQKAGCNPFVERFQLMFPHLEKVEAVVARAPVEASSARFGSRKAYRGHPELLVVRRAVGSPGIQ